MRVLIWKSYEQISAHCIESLEQVIAIRKLVDEVTSGWGIADYSYFIADTDRIIGESALVGAESSRNRLISKIVEYVNDVCDDTDDFEQFVVSRVRY